MTGKRRDGETSSTRMSHGNNAHCDKRVHIKKGNSLYPIRVVGRQSLSERIDSGSKAINTTIHGKSQGTSKKGEP